MQVDKLDTHRDKFKMLTLHQTCRPEKETTFSPIQPTNQPTNQPTEQQTNQLTNY
jgi:hypothetical protein